jgi:hypothetical protein
MVTRAEPKELHFVTPTLQRLCFIQSIGHNFLQTFCPHLRKVCYKADLWGFWWMKI